MKSSEYENNDFSGQGQQYQPGDLSLKGYYAIAALSVTIGIVAVGLLNLATPLDIISDRMAFVSQFSGPLFLLFIPPLIYLLLVYILSLLVVRIILGPISRYLNIVASGGSLPEDLEDRAGRRLLNVPLYG